MFNELALVAFTPLATGAARLVIAAVFLVPVSIMFGHGLPTTTQQWAWSSVIGAIGYALPFHLIVWAQSHIPSNVAALFFASIPLMLLVMSRVFLGVRISKRKSIGFAIGSVGLALLAGPGTFAQIADTNTYLPQIALLAACVFLAGAGIVIRVMPKMSPLQMNAGAMSVAAALSLPVMWSQLSWQAATPGAVLGLIGVGVVSTAVGQLLRFFLIRRRGPVYITPVGYMAGLAGAIMSVVFLGETMPLETILAFSVVLTGVIIAQDGSGNMKQA